MLIRPLGWEVGMATHSSVLAWRIPGMGESCCSSGSMRSPHPQGPPHLLLSVNPRGKKLQPSAVRIAEQKGKKKKKTRGRRKMALNSVKLGDRYCRGIRWVPKATFSYLNLEILIAITQIGLNSLYISVMCIFI